MTDDQILQELGLGSASEEVRRSIIEDVRTVVDVRAGKVVSEALTDDQQAEFERLKDAGDDGAIFDWLRNSVLGTDMRDVYEATLATYLDEVKERSRTLVGEL